MKKRYQLRKLISIKRKGGKKVIKKKKYLQKKYKHSEK